MTEIFEILDHTLDFDPAGDFEAFCRAAPAKWAVYLLADAQNKPVQLLCVKNLRYSLKRRLGEEEMAAPTRRVDYRQVVRHVHYRRVDSALEADLVYYELARRIFPETHQAMLGFRPAWFVHVDPDARFPRYVKTIDLSNPAGVYLGPVEDKHAAARLIELAEDAFDLCRYYNILTESPSGRACAYKEMGKCPAPCDGSISIEQYRRLIEWSVRVLADSQDFLREQKVRMEQAAGELRFETASKIKSFIEELSKLGKGPFRYVRRLADFAFVSIQPGPRSGCAKIFLILPDGIEEIAGVIADLSHPGEVLRKILEKAQFRRGLAVDARSAGIAAHHLFAPRGKSGVFISLAEVTEKSLAKACRDIARHQPPEEEAGEGVQKELEAI